MNKKWNDKIQLELTRKELYVITSLVRAVVSPSDTNEQIKNINVNDRNQAKDTISKSWNKAVEGLKK